MLLWAGPARVPPIAGARVAVLNSAPGGGIATSAFQAWARELRAGGSVLDGALASAGVRAAPGERIYIGAFSAGGGLLEYILASQADRRRLSGCGLFDATYCSNATDPGGKAGLRAGMRDAIQKRYPMVITTSHNPGAPGLPSASDCVARAAGALPPIARVSPPPARCESARGAGFFAWYVYADRETGTQSHAQHATVLAPYFLPRLMNPAAWATRPRSTGSDGAALLALFAFGWELFGDS